MWSVSITVETKLCVLPQNDKFGVIAVGSRYLYTSTTFNLSDSLN